MENPVGYLYRVARTHELGGIGGGAGIPSSPSSTRCRSPMSSPGCTNTLRHLRPDHRVAVVLVHAYGWTYQEVADVSGVRSARSATTCIAA